MTIHMHCRLPGMWVPSGQPFSPHQIAAPLTDRACCWRWPQPAPLPMQLGSQSKLSRHRCIPTIARLCCSHPVQLGSSCHLMPLMLLLSFVSKGGRQQCGWTECTPLPFTVLLQDKQQVAIFVQKTCGPCCQPAAHQCTSLPIASGHLTNRLSLHPTAMTCTSCVQHIMYQCSECQATHFWSAQVEQYQQQLSDSVLRWESASRTALQSEGGLLRAAQDGKHPMHGLEQPILHSTTSLKQATADAHRADR